LGARTSTVARTKVAPLAAAPPIAHAGLRPTSTRYRFNGRGLVLGRQRTQSHLGAGAGAIAQAKTAARAAPTAETPAKTGTASARGRSDRRSLVLGR